MSPTRTERNTMNKKAAHTEIMKAITEATEYRDKALWGKAPGWERSVSTWHLLDNYQAIARAVARWDGVATAAEWWENNVDSETLYIDVLEYLHAKEQTGLSDLDRIRWEMSRDTLLRAMNAFMA